ncbi:hypothetical protein BJX64DRAFT_291184 [Aspergillus heterothallicus]
MQRPHLENKEPRQGHQLHLHQPTTQHNPPDPRAQLQTPTKSPPTTPFSTVCLVIHGLLQQHILTNDLKGTAFHIRCHQPGSSPTTPPSGKDLASTGLSLSILIKLPPRVSNAPTGDEWKLPANLRVLLSLADKHIKLGSPHHVHEWARTQAGFILPGIGTPESLSKAGLDDERPGARWVLKSCPSAYSAHANFWRLQWFADEVAATRVPVTLWSNLGLLGPRVGSRVEAIKEDLPRMAVVSPSPFRVEYLY